MLVHKREFVESTLKDKVNERDPYKTQWSHNRKDKIFPQKNNLIDRIGIRGYEWERINIY